AMHKPLADGRMSTPKNSNLNFLSGLPETLFLKLFNEATECILPSGDSLFRAGDPGDGCYRIQTGLVKIVVASQQGEERIISLLGPGAIVGELSVIDGEPRSASVFAVSDCLMSFVSRARFEKFTEAHPELTSYLVRTLALRLRKADEALAATTFLTVKGRLARALLNLAEYAGKEYNGRIELRHKISQGDLAAMAGVARENVSRTMSDWRKRDIVTRSSDYYCIVDRKALAREMELSD
ncbi:MAG: Crp/Fnr family transcriptional regulator, partial [Bradyrhizobium sp.]